MKGRVGNEEDVSSNLELEKLRWFSRSRILCQTMDRNPKVKGSLDIDANAWLSEA